MTRQNHNDPMNWNLRNIFYCLQNHLEALNVGGCPEFWLAESRRFDLDNLFERN